MKAKRRPRFSRVASTGSLLQQAVNACIMAESSVGEEEGGIPNPARSQPLSPQASRAMVNKAMSAKFEWLVACGAAAEGAALAPSL